MTESEGVREVTALALAALKIRKLADDTGARPQSGDSEDSVAAIQDARAPTRAALGSWSGCTVAESWRLPINRSSESGRGLPHSKTQATVTCFRASARSWTAPVLWRFGFRCKNGFMGPMRIQFWRLKLSINLGVLPASCRQEEARNCQRDVGSTLLRRTCTMRRFMLPMHAQNEERFSVLLIAQPRGQICA
jgi:hypothetical protein